MQASSASVRQVPYLAQVALIAAAYFAVARLSLALAIPPGYATAVWPPSGIALAALLLWGNRLWPGVWIGSFAANLMVEGAPLVAAAFATGSSLQAFAVATLVRRHLGVPRRFARVRDVLVFVGLVAGGAVIAPTVALVPLGAIYPLQVPDLASNWWTWWQGDACGMLIFAPLILSWTARGIHWTRQRIAEAVLFAVLLLVAGGIVFSSGFGRTFVMVPFIVWAAFRFGQREVTTTSAAICAMALWFTLRREIGPFADLPPNETLLLLLIFVSTIVVTGLMLGAVLAQLQASHEDLETRVRERTRLLADSERRFRLMVESVVDYAIVMLDPQGLVTSWNPGARWIHGYGAEEVIGHRFSLFYTDADAEQGRPAQELETAATEGRYEEEGWRVRKSGEQFWASVIITSIRGAKGRLHGFAQVTRDFVEGPLAFSQKRPPRWKGR